MSIKDLFSSYNNNQIQKAQTTNSASALVESSDFIEAKSFQFDEFIPPIDFSSASNFAKFGSAELYYENAFKRIYQRYPYDGTLAEKIEFETVANRPPLEQMKYQFLNQNFFTIRVIAYFLAWGGMAWFFLSNSLKQDKTGDKNLTSRMQAFSAPLMILFAVTVVFSSVDMEMSLSALWFSTMFPVYFFAGAFLSALCTILLTGLWLQKTGRVTDEITIDHYHDLGKLMQGFVIFWGYIAFSQFLLIWYANIPEETFWYNLRINQPGWMTLSILLLVGHLFIPFFLLMGRGLRRNRKLLAFSAVFILAMHWVDHYWLIMPQMNPEANLYTLSGMGIVIDLACMVGVIAVYIAMFCMIAGNRPLVPLKDPRLGEALNHEVH